MPDTNACPFNIYLVNLDSCFNADSIFADEADFVKIKWPTGFSDGPSCVYHSFYDMTIDDADIWRRELLRIRQKTRP